MANFSGYNQLPILNTQILTIITSFNFHSVTNLRWQLQIVGQPRNLNFRHIYCLLKADLDTSDVRSYRPISNLSILSKLLERPVAHQLKAHLDACGLFPRLQSAYRAYHSTETAVLKVLSGILIDIDDGDLSALVLLDLSAALDMVDHYILLRRLDITYRLNGTVLNWFDPTSLADASKFESVLLFHYGALCCVGCRRDQYLASRYDHIMPFLRQLHWLKARERIDYSLPLHVTSASLVKTLKFRLKTFLFSRSYP